MASKRKSYRGTPEQHRKEAGHSLVAMRRAQKEFSRQLQKGNCRLALYALSDARFKHGQYNSDLLWAAARRGRGSGRAVGAMEQRFYKHCVR